MQPCLSHNTLCEPLNRELAVVLSAIITIQLSAQQENTQT